MAKKFINKNIFLCHKFLFLCLCWNSNNNNINYNWHIVSTYLQKKKKNSGIPNPQNSNIR